MLVGLDVRSFLPGPVGSPARREAVAAVSAGLPSRLPPSQRRSSGRAQSTIADVCDELAISRSTFHDWRTKGKAPLCINLPNGEIRVRRTELDRWLLALEDAP
jgi:hypothetical protein